MKGNASSVLQKAAAASHPIESNWSTHDVCKSFSQRGTAFFIRTQVPTGRTGFKEADVQTMSYLERVMRNLSVMPFPIAVFSSRDRNYSTPGHLPMMAEVRFIGSKPFSMRRAFWSYTAAENKGMYRPCVPHSVHHTWNSESQCRVSYAE